MVEIPKEILDAVVSHAQGGLPLEVCGILGGSGRVVASHYPMTNTDASKDHFMMDPKEQFAVARALRASGQQMLVIYHSHPESPPLPSQEDIRLASAPNVHHLIVSLQERDQPVARAFRIEEGTVEPVELSVI